MIFGKFFLLFFKNNCKRNNHRMFIHHKSYLKPFLSYLPCIVCREYFSIIFNVKMCTLYSIQYGTRDHNIHIERADMHCQCTACAKSFDMGSTSADRQKLDCFIWEEDFIFYKYYENLVNPLSSKVMLIFISPRLSLCVYCDLYEWWELETLY